MKKIMTFIIAAFFGATAMFAAEDAGKASFNVGVSVPQVFNYNPANRNIDVECYNSWGINAGFRVPIAQNKIGFFVDGNFYSPYAYNARKSGVTNTINNNWNNRMFGIDGMFGAYTVLVSDSKLVIPVGIGPNFNFAKVQKDIKHSDNRYSMSELSLGIGLFVNAEIKVSDSVSLYGGVRGAYDFFQHTYYRVYNKETNTTNAPAKTNADNYHNWVNEIVVAPVVGLVFRF